MIDKVHHNDALSQMSTMPDNFIDCVVTDPPYGLVSRNTAGEASGGFMGKEWDKAVPSVDIWKEVFRVLKPGAFAFVMSIPRQDCQAKMVLNLQEAGFDISYSPILWAQAAGFPKAQNIAKQLEKRLGVERKVVGIKQHATGLEGAIDSRTGYLQDPANQQNNRMFGYGEEVISESVSPEAQALDGSYSGIQLKPAYEVVLCVQKPLVAKHKRSDVYRILGNRYDYWYTQKTVVQEPTEHSKGNIAKLTKKWEAELYNISYTLQDGDVIERRLALNPGFQDEVIINRDSKLVLWWGAYKDSDLTSSVTHALETGKGISWLDNGRIPYESDDDIWKDHTATGLAKDKFFTRGEQSIIDKSPNTQGRFAPNLLVSDDILNDGKVTKSNPHPRSRGGKTFRYVNDSDMRSYANDSGSFSRYFSLDAWAEANLPDSVKRTFPFLIVPKAAKSEKNKGLEDGENKHPCTKPVRLMSYLIAIGSRPGDVVLDPYAGSGTTGVAAALLDRRYILMELDAEYVDIGRRRIAWHVEQQKAEEQAQLKLF